VTLGAIATAQSIGAALSNLAAGYIVQAGGYQAGFLSLAGIATLALFLFYWAMPETKNARAYIKKPEHLMSGTHHRMFKKAFQRGRSER
jgi:MFS family permease